MSSVSTPWIDEARRHIGTSEVSGPEHNPQILAWWKAIKRGGIQSDEVPWCAAFVGGCLETAGIVSTRFESAKSYLTWGQGLNKPAYGCVVVFERQGGGHVGFVVGQDDNGRLLVLGGNQNNSVNITPFDKARVAGYRWPKGWPLSEEDLPLTATNAESSTNEA